MTTTDTTNEQGEGMVCSADGVVVRIRSREARGEVPAYEYVVGSERSAPVAVRISQPVPEGIAEADLGFPSACEGHWSLVDDALVAELVIDPDDQFQTVWGVRGDSHPEIEPPAVDVSPIGGENEDAASDDETAAADGSEASDDTALDLDDPLDEAGAPDDGSLAADGSIGDDGVVGDDGSVLSPTEEDDAFDVDDVLPAADAEEPADGPAGGDSDGSLVAQLVAELEAGTIDDDQRAALVDALEFAASDSTNAFVEHVQSKLDRRADRLQDDLESLEDSVEQLYGVKADANEIASIKRGLTQLEDESVSRSDLAVLEDRLEQSSESAASERASIREEIESLSERAAEAERVATVADDLAELRADAATDAEVEALREDVESVQAGVAELREELATVADDLEGDLDAMQADLRNELSAVEDDHESLVTDHEALADRAATTDDVDQLRNEHRTQINAAKSDVASLEHRLESEYTPAEEISADVDRRLHRSIGTLVLFGIGTTGLLSTLPLALAGTGDAAITFLGGAIALAAWWYFLGTDSGASLEELPSPGDVLRRQ